MRACLILKDQFMVGCMQDGAMFMIDLNTIANSSASKGVNFFNWNILRSNASKLSNTFPTSICLLSQKENLSNNEHCFKLAVGF